MIYRSDFIVIVPAAEFERNTGTYQDRALIEPVFVTRNGREKTVLLSVEEYRRLKRRDREVLAVSQLSDEDLNAIALAEMPAEFNHLDAELDK
jgi:PHD/YefM family antitoxin component YafN of YafNO toxin-antitoxin module